MAAPQEPRIRDGWIREAADYAAERSEPVGAVLQRWAAKSGVLKASDRDRIWNAWQHLLGRDAAHTTLEGLRNKVVTFTVDSSALLSELNNFRKQELLDGLRREVRTYFVRDIRLRLEKRRPPSSGGKAGPG
jgi:predicted nucleic acid-binding Zn ribbon protein